MPRVRILAETAGNPLRLGEELDLPANEARDLVEQGRAEYVRGARVDTPERSQARERATKTGTQRRKRG